MGKTSLAEYVSRELGLTHIDVSQIALEMGAVVKQDGNSSVVDTDILSKKLEDMDNIIIDSHFAEMFDVDIVFVLRCEPKILYKRLKERGYSQEKIIENVEAEILDYCLISALENHDLEKVFEIYENAEEEILELVKNPVRERSAACGSKTHFLTEENLKLVE